jgi:hypothetical protein
MPARAGSMKDEIGFSRKTEQKIINHHQDTVRITLGQVTTGGGYLTIKKVSLITCQGAHRAP